MKPDGTLEPELEGKYFDAVAEAMDVSGAPAVMLTAVTSMQQWHEELRPGLDAMVRQAMLHGCQRLVFLVFPEMPKIDWANLNVELVDPMAPSFYGKFFDRRRSDSPDDSGGSPALPERGETAHEVPGLGGGRGGAGAAEAEGDGAGQVPGGDDRQGAGC